MNKETFISIVLPVYNESNRIDEVIESIYNQKSRHKIFSFKQIEVIFVDNNSTDDSVEKIKNAKERYPALDIHLIYENVQGVSSARKKGMDYASERSKIRNAQYNTEKKHYIVSADADCTVDPYWIDELIYTMISQNGDLGTCNYYYKKEDFSTRPNLFREIEKTLRCRDFSFSLFGGFPDGKGFGVERTLYDRIGGIEIFYQLKNGKFVEHLSDDWDFGIKVIAYGGKPVYAPKSFVEINSRRVDTLLEEVINGVAYGKDGVIIMKDVRPEKSIAQEKRDLNSQESQQAWDYSIKDYIPKNIVLPLLLNPSILIENEQVKSFFGAHVAEKIYQRIFEIKQESGILNFRPIHLYKTPAFRLYFEFREELFHSLRKNVGEEIGYPPTLPSCFNEIQEKDFHRFVYYYCEDRESGEAHNYFANGGVF